MIKWLGIRWSAHPLFVVIMLASLVTGYFGELFTLFLIVLVHEIGHVVVARGFGWRIREVKLLPFGGVAEVEEASGTPASQDALVAIAGPLQNVWMGLAAWGCGQLGWWDQDAAQYVWKANAMIGLFNLLPIYPLDGGKLLQALFSLGLNYYAMMKWTARISMALSLIMIVLALGAPLFFHSQGVQLNLLIIGAFLVMTNWTYYRNIPFLFVRFLMHRGRVAERAERRGVRAAPIIVGASQPLASVVRLLKREQTHLICIIGRSGKVAAVIPEEQLVDRYFEERNPNRPIGELLR
ncbi:M50 family metallopeptidase [Paenibacillus sp. NPDC058071]|uniref:M50 family metallopeptidase n=1 Tax=Paenibacillus sp. NPDC058071 TaxID=3346326 RepID=UPI0036DB2D67